MPRSVEVSVDIGKRKMFVLPCPLGVTANPASTLPLWLDEKRTVAVIIASGTAPHT